MIKKSIDFGLTGGYYWRLEYLNWSFCKVNENISFSNNITTTNIGFNKNNWDIFIMSSNIFDFIFIVNCSPLIAL